MVDQENFLFFFLAAFPPLGRIQAKLRDWVYSKFAIIPLTAHFSTFSLPTIL